MAIGNYRGSEKKRNKWGEGSEIRHDRHENRLPYCICNLSQRLQMSALAEAVLGKLSITSLAFSFSCCFQSTALPYCVCTRDRNCFKADGRHGRIQGWTSGFKHPK